MSLWRKYTWKMKQNVLTQEGNQKSDWTIVAVNPDNNKTPVLRNELLNFGLKRPLLQFGNNRKLVWVFAVVYSAFKYCSLSYKVVYSQKYKCLVQRIEWAPVTPSARFQIQLDDCFYTFFTNRPVMSAVMTSKKTWTIRYIFCFKDRQLANNIACHLMINLYV